MDPEAIPDIDGWEAYCESCGAFQEARRVQVRCGELYFEFVCDSCQSILMTFQRLGTQNVESTLEQP